MNWSAQTDFETVCKRAAGRRRYNAERQAEARKRYKQVKDVIWSPDGCKRGTQAELARAFGVHRSTICRDVAKWRKLWQDVMQRYPALKAERERLDAEKLMNMQAHAQETENQTDTD
jgi:hypothetical protein